MLTSRPSFPFLLSLLFSPKARLPRVIVLLPALISILADLNCSILMQKDHLTRPPPSPLPKALRNQLLLVVPRLRSLKAHIQKYPAHFYVTLDNLEAFANMDDDPRTDSARDGFMAMGGYLPFCSSAAGEGEVEFGAVPCGRKDLKGCTKVSWALSSSLD